DLDPAHEALLLKEHFKELLRMQDVATKPDPFRESLRASETAAQELQDALRIQPANRAAAKSAFDAVTANCKSCHRAFRDNPAKSAQ
ncbi:MAG: cytochrome c, partial [Planctomycetaceae bacterium]